MNESPRSTLYRTFLLVAIPILLLVGLTFRLQALSFLAGMWTLHLLVGFARARRRLRALDARREAPATAYEGDAPAIGLILENRGRGAAELVEISDRFGPSLAETHIVEEPGPIPGRATVRVEYIGHCGRHWGNYAVGPLEIATTDPMGLFHATRPLPLIQTVSVFPRVYDVRGFERLGGRDSLALQEVTAGRAGQSLLYLGIRSYRPGDDPRRIHWPATARRGELMVKEYEVDLVPYFTLFLDLERANKSGTGRRATLEYVVRTGASLLWSATRRGDFVQLFAEDAAPVAIPPGKGDGHLALALHELIQTKQEGTVPVTDLVERRLTDLPAGSTAAVLWSTSTPPSTAVRQMIERFRARSVRPAFVFVNNHSFTPLDKWPLPAPEVKERHRELAALLRSRGVPFAILGGEDELEDRLARPDFLV